MFNSQIFAERLKSARNKKHLSQAELAKGVGVSAATISSYETPNGTKIPALDKAAAIASELDVSLDWLCGNKNQCEDVTDFDKNTYLRALVIVLSEANTDFSENGDKGCITFNFHPLTYFAKRVRDVLNVYRAGTLSKDLYETCVKKIIEDCSDYNIFGDAFLRKAEIDELYNGLMTILSGDPEVKPGIYSTEVTPPFEPTRQVSIFVSEQIIEELR